MQSVWSASFLAAMTRTSRETNPQDFEASPGSHLMCGSPNLSQPGLQTAVEIPIGSGYAVIRPGLIAPSQSPLSPTAPLWIELALRWFLVSEHEFESIVAHALWPVRNLIREAGLDRTRKALASLLRIPGRFPAIADMNRYAASCAARTRSRSPLVFRASSTSLRNATEAPPGCTFSQSQCRGKRVTSFAIHAQPWAAASARLGGPQTVVPTSDLWRFVAEVEVDLRACQSSKTMTSPWGLSLSSSTRSLAVPVATL